MKKTLETIRDLSESLDFSNFGETLSGIDWDKIFDTTEISTISDNVSEMMQSFDEFLEVVRNIEEKLDSNGGMDEEVENVTGEVNTSLSENFIGLERIIEDTVWKVAGLLSDDIEKLVEDYKDLRHGNLIDLMNLSSGTIDTMKKIGDEMISELLELELQVVDIADKITTSDVVYEGMIPYLISIGKNLHNVITILTRLTAKETEGEGEGDEPWKVIGDLENIVHDDTEKIMDYLDDIMDVLKNVKSGAVSITKTISVKDKEKEIKEIARHHWEEIREISKINHLDILIDKVDEANTLIDEQLADTRTEIEIFSQNTSENFSRLLKKVGELKEDKAELLMDQEMEDPYHG